MMGRFFQALGWVLMLAAAGAPASGVAAPALAQDLQQLLQQQQLAGAVVATVDGPRTELLALGVFNASTGQALQTTHRVQVGSIAKHVLALGVLRLVSQGRLDLDAPLSALLPQLALHNPWHHRSPVRLRHLLDMSAGLPDVQLWHVFNRQHTAQQPLALALRPEAGPIRLRSEPGTRYSYSNLGFTLVGMVVEAITGERYEAWIARELLEPLGMRHSSFGFRGQPADAALAWGHLDDGQPVAEWPVAVRPAAHFNTTAADMARLMRFLLGDGRLLDQPDQPPFVQPALMAGLGVSATTDAARAGLRSGYALGLALRDRHGAVGLCHGGSAGGWRAMFCVFRDAQRGFFIALNSDREDARYALFDQRLIQHLALAQAPPAPTPLQPASRPPAADMAWRGFYVPAPGRFQALTLPDRLLGFWWLDLQPDHATLREGLAPARRLVPVGHRLYRQADRQQASLVLLQDEQGRPMLASGTLTLRPMPMWELAALWTSATLGALGLLAVLPAALWRWRRDGLRAASARVPAAWALLVLMLTLAAWTLQGWQHLGEATPIAMGLAAATLLWPLACAAQLLQAWRLRRDRRGALFDGLIGLAGLQAALLLAAFGVLPLIAWRVF